MRVGLAIDVSTDVTPEFVRENGIHVLPSTIHMGDQSVVYDRDQDKGLAFYREHLDSKGVSSETTPFSVREIEDLFLKKLILDYDYVFLITLASTRSLTYENAHKASFTILQSYSAIRQAQSVPGPFALRVVDSQALFTGPGVLAWEAARMVRERRSPVDMRKRLDDLIPHLYSYLVPADLYYIRERGQRRGDSSISWFAYQASKLLDIKPIIRAHRSETATVAKISHHSKAVEKLFHHGAERIRKGLLVPMVGVSYGGDPAEVRGMAGFEALASAAREAGVELMLSMMAPAGAVNIGGKAVTLAYCAQDAGEFSA